MFDLFHNFRAKNDRLEQRIRSGKRANSVYACCIVLTHVICFSDGLSPFCELLEDAPHGRMPAALRQMSAAPWHKQHQGY